MANVLNLPPNPNSEALGRGAQGMGTFLANFIIKRKQDQQTKDYITQLIQTKQAEDERALTSGGQVDPNVGMLVDAPRHLDIATRVGLVNQVFKRPTKEAQDDLVSYFKPPAIKGQLPELVAELPKGSKRPPGTYDRQEIASFLQFPSEGKQPTEKEQVLGSELRTFKDAFKGVDKQVATDRVRLYQAGENDLQTSITQSLGVFNKDTNRTEINQPELVRKVPHIQKEVKRLMYSGEVKDWQEGLLKAYDKFGVEPPMKPELPAPPPKDTRSVWDKLMGNKSAPTAPAPAPAARTPVAPLSQAPVEEVTLGAAEGKEVKVPTSVKGAKAIHEYVMKTYGLDDATSKRLLLRYAAKP